MFPNANESGILRYANTFFLSSEKPMGHNAPKLNTDFSPVLIGRQSRSRLGMVCYGRVWFIMLSFQSLICKSVWPAETCFSTTTTTWQEIIQATYVHMGLSLTLHVHVCVCVCASLCKYERPRPITHLKKWNFWHCFILLSVY